MAHPETQRRLTRSRSKLVLVLLAVVAAVAIGLLASGDWGDDGRDAPAQDGTTTVPPTAIEASRVTQFEGTGDTETGSFQVSTGWEIRWSAPTDSAFAVELLTAAGESRGMIISGEETANGSTYVSEAGEFKLRVASQKPWTIEIFSRPAEE